MLRRICFLIFFVFLIGGCSEDNEETMSREDFLQLVNSRATNEIQLGKIYPLKEGDPYIVTEKSVSVYNLNSEKSIILLVDNVFNNPCGVMWDSRSLEYIDSGIAENRYVRLNGYKSLNYETQYEISFITVALPQSLESDYYNNSEKENYALFAKYLGPKYAYKFTYVKTPEQN